MKKFFVMFAAAAMFVDCGGADKKAEEQKGDNNAPAIEDVTVEAEDLPVVEGDFVAQAIELSERALDALTNNDEAAFEAIMVEMEALDATLTDEQRAIVEEAVMQWGIENGLI